MRSTARHSRIHFAIPALLRLSRALAPPAPVCSTPIRKRQKRCPPWFARSRRLPARPLQEQVRLRGAGESLQESDEIGTHPVAARGQPAAYPGVGGEVGQRPLEAAPVG